MEESLENEVSRCKELLCCREQDQTNLQYLFFARIDFLQVSVCKETLLVYALGHYCLFSTVATTHTPTFIDSQTFFISYTFVSPHPVLSFIYRIGYCLQWEKEVLRDRGKSNKSIP